jgi:hypothetical protein
MTKALRIKGFSKSEGFSPSRKQKASINEAREKMKGV